MTTATQERTPTRAATPRTFELLLSLDARMSESLGPVLYDLVKLRASQLNGCAYCVDKHARDLERRGVPPRTVYGVAAWRESPFFDDEQRVALAFTEALTGGVGHVSDALWDDAGRFLGEERRGDLVIAVGTITTWNMSAVTTGLRPSAI
jgi:AhpD family alkylhydroperoxidase